MNKVILLAADSGSGKDFVLEIANSYDSIEAVKRYISRAPRENEENSISSIFKTPIWRIKQLDYYYEGIEEGNWYGILKADLDRVLNNGKSPMVICPNYENMQKMISDYSGNVVVFFIYRDYGSNQIEKWRESLIARGSSLKEIERRKNKRDKYFRELYISHFNEYSQNVILNLYGITTKEDIKLQLEGLFRKNDIDIEFAKRRR